MLFKTTLKLLLVNTDTKSLLLPIVSNSYKKTLWLLLHREPTAIAVGVIEGPYSDLSYLNIGEVDIPNLHQLIMRTTNALYTSIGKQPTLPNTFTLDYTLDMDNFIMKYSNMFTPDELMVTLGTSHNILFKRVGALVRDNKIAYEPDNGPGNWGYYDYFWLHERYKHKVLLDIKDIIKRSRHQIKFRAYAIGLARKHKKKIVNNIDIDMADPLKQPKASKVTSCICGRPIVADGQCKACSKVILSSVTRDYMISQIITPITNILKG